MENTEELDKDVATHLEEQKKKANELKPGQKDIQKMIGNNINPLPAMLSQIEEQLLSSDKKKEISSQIIDTATESISSIFKGKLPEYLSYPKKYFDLNTSDVRRRLIYSIIPFNSDFYDIAKRTPDLYGPFWIFTTIAFLIAAASVISTMNDSTIQEFQELFPIAGTVIYSFGIILSLITYICFIIVGEPCPLVGCICLYGYALSVFIPALIVCFFKFELGRWILLIYAAVASSFFLIVNIKKATMRCESNLKFLLFGIVVIGQVFLFSVLRFHFFSSK